MAYGKDTVGSDARYLVAIEADGHLSGLFALTAAGSAYKRDVGAWKLLPPKWPFIADSAGIRFVSEDFVEVYDQLAPHGFDLADIAAEYWLPDKVQRSQLPDGEGFQSGEEPAAWESKVRGLALGLALGDSLGTSAGTPPTEGPLRGGAATQLAAWTMDGLLRNFTENGWAIRSGLDQVAFSYRRWALLRQEPEASNPSWAAEVLGECERAPGWLMEDPVMSLRRGSSPSMVTAIVSRAPTRSPSVRPMVKGLPYAVLAGAGAFSTSGPDKIAHYAGMLARQTHHDAESIAVTATSALIMVQCLRDEGPVATARRARPSLNTWGGGMSVMQGLRSELLDTAQRHGHQNPGSTDVLRGLIDHGSPSGVLARALYVALSFPAPEETIDALRFVGTTADARSVASVTLAFLGATHGYESLPVASVSRLEYGWVMDRLAIDLAQRVAAADWYRPAVDQRWISKYPAVLPRDE